MKTADERGQEMQTAEVEGTREEVIGTLVKVLQCNRFIVKKLNSMTGVVQAERLDGTEKDDKRGLVTKYTTATCTVFEVLDEVNIAVTLRAEEYSAVGMVSRPKDDRYCRGFLALVKGTAKTKGMGVEK